MRKGLLVLIVLALLLVSCTGLEAIDRGGCKLDCERAGLQFSRYVYKPHECFCLTPDGEEMQAY